MPTVIAIAAGRCPPSLLDAVAIVLAVVDMAAATNGPRKCSALLVLAVVGIGNDAKVMPVLLPPPLLAASGVL
jgi:hypothetical protein